MDGNGLARMYSPIFELIQNQGGHILTRKTLHKAKDYFIFTQPTTIVESGKITSFVMEVLLKEHRICKYISV